MSVFEAPRNACQKCVHCRVVHMVALASCRIKIDLTSARLCHCLNASIDVNVNALKMHHICSYGMYSVFEMHLKSITSRDDNVKIHAIKTNTEGTSSKCFFCFFFNSTQTYQKHAANALGALMSV